jgi:hypothetical protein
MMIKITSIEPRGGIASCFGSLSHTTASAPAWAFIRSLYARCSPRSPEQPTKSSTSRASGSGNAEDKVWDDV